MKDIRKHIRNIILENIPLDIDIGDVILTGRFKNKRRIVRSIGVDKLGQPTINGRSILKFKIEKKLPRNKWSAKSKKMNMIDQPKKIKTEKQLRRTIREAIQHYLILENEEKEMIDKLNTMLDVYYEQENARNYIEDTDSDYGVYEQAMELARSLDLDKHPELKVWQAADDEDGEIIASGMTQEEALNIKDWSGEKVYTKGELAGPDSTTYIYYLQFPGWENIINLKR